MAVEDLYDVFGFDDARSLRDLLEDFEMVGRGDYCAIIPAIHADTDVRRNVEASLLAGKLHLSSVDYTRRNYGPGPDTDVEQEAPPPVKKYVRAYLSCKHYIDTMLSKALPFNDEPHRWGAFAASVALTRLQYSFFAAHLLYQLGHKYEAHAVSRQIFEQVAWAYAASELDNLEDIKRLVTTKCVRNLRKLDPTRLGRFYGILNLRVHLDSQSHADILRIENGVGVIRFTHLDYHEYASVILVLADLFGVVWELSQATYIQNFEATELSDGTRSIKKDRLFLEVIKHHLAGLSTTDSEPIE